MTGDLQNPTGRHQMALELSNEMVQLYKRLFGRGPARAQTHFAGPDTVVCTLEKTFTPAELRTSSNSSILVS